MILERLPVSDRVRFLRSLALLVGGPDQVHFLFFLREQVLSLLGLSFELADGNLQLFDFLHSLDQVSLLGCFGLLKLNFNLLCQLFLPAELAA